MTQKPTSQSRKFAAATCLVMLSSWITASSQAQDEEDKRAPMFERSDYVGLAGKEIPEFHKRKEITDSQNRSIKGEWVFIDRKSKKVKFRRMDAKEFDIGMANLAPRDRRYAELETGCLWQIDPLPTPVDIVKEDILAFESMDDTHIRLRCVFPKDPNVLYVPEFAVNLLSDMDRARIKEKTGREFPILPRPQPERASGAWKFPLPMFGHEVPKFTPSYYKATLGLMHKTYSLTEIVDAVRTRTMTSAFIHEFFEAKWNEAEPERKAGTKSLVDMLKILGETPSPDVEAKSIKPTITKFKLAPFEEKVPRDPAQPLRFRRGDRSVLSQPGVPIDGELQAFHFMSQYLRLSANQPKIRLATLLESTQYRFTGIGQIIDGKQTDVPPEQRRKIYTSTEILPGIEKTYGYKAWKAFTPLYRTHSKPEGVELEFIHQLTLELIRQHIRNGSPVYARLNEDKQQISRNGTQLVIIGFKAEKGKPLMLETINIKGSTWGEDPYTGEYQVTEAMVPESELATMTVSFLEAP